MNTSATAALSRAPSTTATQDIVALIGRVLIAWLFIPAGWGKLMGFSGVVGYIGSHGVPVPEVAAALAVAAELGLGLLVLVGWQARWAALGLALFVVVITPIFHNYWSVPAQQVMMMKQAFDKNVAIVGGLLLLSAMGPGRLSFAGRNGRV
jgi:putative oxidoreductase